MRFLLPILSLMLVSCASTPKRIYSDKKCLKELDALAAERLSFTSKSESKDRSVATFTGKGLTGDEVGNSVHSEFESIKTCFDESSIHTSGKFVYAFLIGPSGAVDKACMQSTDFTDIPFRNCMMSTLRKIRFPAPSGKSSVKVNYPILFNHL